ncbi:glutathione S-transferase [Cognatishimia sp. F0-27]|uniref:glutathione S-transferase n=1 Tax=Cognatishimia sp. F0-27 TaxID=2816855 RepID=UPI001D0C1AA4|nr:glutathione S-transferase [Cognatishimia sp. F0-27]MCC1493953.1 glutathione S-transferase [Cognatishimia sp. F0-27]
MSDTLIIGDYAYSSWSLRGWLLFDRFGIAVTLRRISFLDAEVRDQLSDLPPARTVPLWQTAEGGLLRDSIAIAEELAQRHPDAGFWPDDPILRATARSLTAEMHAGFAALREYCPMNLRAAYRAVPVPEPVRTDLDRIEELWALALEHSGGPWLCGAYSVADAFYAPVAARIAGYGLPVGPVGQGYVEAHLGDPAFRRWRCMGLVQGPDLPWYRRDYPRADWPGPAPRTARAVETGPAENTACPYSGDPVTHFMETDGRVFGFASALCRNETVADQDAWPAFVAMRDGA